MRRPARILLATLSLPALLVSGCSGTAGPGTAAGRLGDPSDTASPIDTTTPTPSGSTPSAAPLPATSAATTEPVPADLATCLTGSWSAPLTREFAPLGISGRSRGIVRSGSGRLELRLQADRTWTVRYDAVRLQLLVGTATIDGPVTGTWSLAGSGLSLPVDRDAAAVSYRLGEVSVGAGGVLDALVRSLPAPRAFVTCTNSQLIMLLPRAEGGGTVTFDRG